MRLGLWGARADHGGLASQTREFHRHLNPARTLLVDLAGGGRGQVHPAWYPGAQVVHGQPTEADADGFLDGLDVVWCAETTYLPDFFDRARRAGVRSFLHANPELWKADHAPPDVTLTPTTWRLDLLPADARVLPFPVARDRLPFTRRTEARTFLHLAAPAMLDRNGTRLVLAAMAHVRHPTRLIVRGFAGRLPGRIRNVEIVRDDTERADYWSGWSPEADVLLLPRRYAGQSLAMNEALSLGMPVVSLDLAPQNGWLPPECLVPARGRRKVRMAGGTVDVADADPRTLARVIDRLWEDDDLAAACSDAANARADAISWETLLPDYQATLST